MSFESIYEIWVFAYVCLLYKSCDWYVHSVVSYAHWLHISKEINNTISYMSLVILFQCIFILITHRVMESHSFFINIFISWIYKLCMIRPLFGEYYCRLLIMIYLLKICIWNKIFDWWNIFVECFFWGVLLDLRVKVICGDPFNCLVIVCGFMSFLIIASSSWYCWQLIAVLGIIGLFMVILEIVGWMMIVYEITW